jgi:hypothetical protein
MAYGTYKGKSLRPGGGGRFARLVDRLRARGYSEKRARAIAASVGRRKYGAKQMAAWAAAGRRRRSRK